MKIIILYCLLVTGGITQAESLLLYDTGNAKGRYLLSRTYEESDNYTVSEIIVCDSFAVKLNGTVCQATISNAFVYLAKFKDDSSLQSTNTLRQYKMFNPTLTVGFLPDTKLIFNNTLMNLADFKPTLANQGGVVTYKGDALKEEMKKLGVKPPPDADMTR